MSRASRNRRGAALLALAACTGTMSQAAPGHAAPQPAACLADRPAAHGGACASVAAVTHSAWWPTQAQHLGLPPAHAVRHLGLTVGAEMITPVSAGGRSGVRDGVYLRTQFFGTQLYTSTYQIRGNRIAENPRKVLGPSEFTGALAAKVGTWRIEGDRMIVRWEGEPREFSNSFSKSGNCPNFMGGVTCPVATFRNRERVTGTFKGTASAGGGGNVFSSTRLQLNADGTYVLTRTGSVVTRDTSAGSRGVEQGRYELSANSSMRLTPANGTAREVLVFPFPAKDPEYLWFEGQMLEGKVIRN